jgi:hypothetical protein
MKQLDFENAFKPSMTRLVRLGFAETVSSELSKVLESPIGCKLEFGGDRYYDGLSVSISGRFSNDAALVFPLLADVVDPLLAKRIRLAGTAQETVTAITDFLEKHLTKVVNEPHSYLLTYNAELSRLGYA